MNNCEKTNGLSMIDKRANLCKTVVLKRHATLVTKKIHKLKSKFNTCYKRVSGFMIKPKPERYIIV